MLTLNQIVDQIKTLANDHYQIAEVGVGTIAELQSKPDRKYPLLWLSNEGGTLDNNYKVDNIRLTMFGRVTVGDEGQDDDASELEVLSDMQLILLDFLNYFHQQHGQEYVTDKSNTLEHFTERTNDRTAGYSTVLELKQFYDWNKCQIPQSGASIPPTVDGLTLYDFCDADVIARLTPTQIACLEAELCSCADATVENSDQSYQTTVASGGTLVLPNISFTDSDGSVSSVPSVKDIVATQCTPSVTVSVALSDDTPKLGQVITITATVTGVTPTSYTFYLPQEDGTLERVTQAGNTYDWTVVKYEDFTVTVRATDGSSQGVGTVEGTTTGDVDADAIITAQETAIGSSMDATAQAWVLGFILRTKGVYTTFAEDVFGQLKAANAELYAMFPDTSTTASVAGYSINAIDPTNNATMVGFVAGDATINGLTGGAGKYMIMNNAPSDYGQNDVGIDCYLRSNAGLGIPIGAGNGDNTSATSGVFFFQVGSTGSMRVKCNSNVLILSPNTSTQSFNDKFISVQRNSTKGAGIFQNVELFSVNSNPVQYTPSSNVFYGMALNNSGTPNNNSSNSTSMLCNRPYLEECALFTLFEAVEWLQTQIGRNV